MFCWRNIYSSTTFDTDDRYNYPVHPLKIQTILWMCLYIPIGTHSMLESELPLTEAIFSLYLLVKYLNQ